MVIFHRTGGILRNILHLQNNLLRRFCRFIWRGREDVTRTRKSIGKDMTSVTLQLHHTQWISQHRKTKQSRRILSLLPSDTQRLVFYGVDANRTCSLLYYVQNWVILLCVAKSARELLPCWVSRCLTLWKKKKILKLLTLQRLLIKNKLRIRSV